MKRLLAVFTAILTLAAFTACNGNEPAETAIPATEAPTQSPYIDTPVDEPEWTLAEGELTLEDKDYLYAEKSDFVCFAVVGAEPENMKLLFRFDDVTAKMLTQQSKANQYYITLDGKKIGNASISDDGFTATIAAEDAAEEITTLATRIRGLR